jgi:hypothetical protein
MARDGRHQHGPALARAAERVRCGHRAVMSARLTWSGKLLVTIDVQMGQARWAGTETARKSPALEQPSKKVIVPRAGTARWSDRAWAAFSAQWPGTGHGTISSQPDAARRPANSPRIRRINTDENPNSLLLPLPQPPTPPPPSLVNVSAAPLP